MNTNPRIKKIQAITFLAALALLAIVWALTGYQNTWLYIVLIPVIIPNSWWVELVNKMSGKNKV